MLAYTYSQVFDSKLYGFLFAVPIVYVGCICGATTTFIISRYLFKDVIKEQISHSQWLLHNFNLIDSILETDGKLIVALLRMTYAPFGITSYIMGVSSISLFDYFIGNFSYIVMTCS